MYAFVPPPIGQDAMSAPRWRRFGLRRQWVARAVADCFLAAALQQQPFLQAFRCVAIHAMIQPAALFGAVSPLTLGGRLLARRALCLRRNGRRHKNRQGKREPPEGNRHVGILRRRANLRILGVTGAGLHNLFLITCATAQRIRAAGP